LQLCEYVNFLHITKAILVIILKGHTIMSKNERGVKKTAKSSVNPIVKQQAKPAAKSVTKAKVAKSPAKIKVAKAAKVAKENLTSISKRNLIDSVSATARLTKTDAENAVNVFIETIRHGLIKGKEIKIVGFGTFYVTKRTARVGRNPRTGESVKIAASNTGRFRSGSSLKNL